MVEQFYVTSSPIGLEKKTAGVQIRAASPGLADPKSPRVIALKEICVYELPKGVAEHSAKPEDSPTNLTFTKIGSEQVIVHNVYVGADKHNRSGNFFAHLLAGLPEEWTAREAIRLWNSPFWKRNADHLAEKTDLPSLTPKEIKSGNLNGVDSAVRNSMAMVIHAYLLLKPKDRLFIASPSDQVAGLIWVVTHVLPKFLLRDLTFSTYERDPESAQLKVVGTCWEGQCDLPPACYQGYGIGINCYTGATSPILENQDSREARYALFAAQELVGNYKGLAAFIEAVEQANISEPKDFFLYYELVSRDPHAPLETPDKVNLVIKNSFIARLFLPREGVQDSIIQLALENLEWWDTVGQREIQKLRSSADRNDELAAGLEKLADRTVRRIYAMLKSPAINTAACARLLEGLAATALAMDGGLEKAFVKLSGLFNKELGSEPWRFDNWAIRTWMINEWATIQNPKDSIAKSAMEQWLNVSWKDLPNLLLSRLTPDVKRAAIKRCIQRGAEDPVPANIAQVAEVNAEDFGIVLEQLVAPPESRQTGIAFFGQLVEKGYKRKMDLLKPLLKKIQSDLVSSDQLLEQARLTTRGEIQVLIDDQGAKFLYDMRIRDTGKKLLGTYYQGLAAETDKENKTAALSKLADAAKNDRIFISDMLERAKVETADEARLLVDKRGIKFLVELRSYPVGTKLLGLYLQWLASMVIKTEKMDRFNKLWDVLPSQDQDSDEWLERANIGTWEEIRLHVEKRGVQFLYDNRNRTVRQRLLETYASGFGIDQLGVNPERRIELLKDLLNAAPDDRVFDECLGKANLRTSEDIQRLLAGWIEKFHNVNFHQARERVLQTFLRGLSHASDQSPETKTVLDELEKDEKKINLDSLRSYLKVHLKLPKIRDDYKDFESFHEELRKLKPVDRESIARIAVLKFKDFENQSRQWAEELEPLQGSKPRDGKSVVPTTLPETPQETKDAPPTVIPALQTRMSEKLTAQQDLEPHRGGREWWKEPEIILLIVFVSLAICIACLVLAWVFRGGACEPLSTGGFPSPFFCSQPTQQPVVPLRQPTPRAFSNPTSAPPVVAATVTIAAGTPTPTATPNTVQATKPAAVPTTRVPPATATPTKLTLRLDSVPGTDSYPTSLKAVVTGLRSISVDTTYQPIPNTVPVLVYDRRPQYYGSISSAVWFRDGTSILFTIGYLGVPTDKTNHYFINRDTIPPLSALVRTNADGPVSYVGQPMPYPPGAQLETKIYWVHQDAIWSPDMQNIALLYTNPDTAQGCPAVISADGSGMRNLSSNCEADDHPRYWSDDGNWVIVWSDRSSSFFAYNTKEPKRVTLADLGAIRMYDERYFPWRVITQPICSAKSFWNCE